jgi:hypothetical protein
MIPPFPSPAGSRFSPVELNVTVGTDASDAAEAVLPCPGTVSIPFRSPLKIVSEMVINGVAAPLEESSLRTSFSPHDAVRTKSTRQNPIANRFTNDLLILTSRKNSLSDGTLTHLRAVDQLMPSIGKTLADWKWAAVEKFMTNMSSASLKSAKFEQSYRFVRSLADSPRTR